MNAMNLAECLVLSRCSIKDSYIYHWDYLWKHIMNLFLSYTMKWFRPVIWKFRLSCLNIITQLLKNQGSATELLEER